MAFIAVPMAAATVAGAKGVNGKAVHMFLLVPIKPLTCPNKAVVIRPTYLRQVLDFGVLLLSFTSASHSLVSSAGWDLGPAVRFGPA